MLNNNNYKDKIGFGIDFSVDNTYLRCINLKDLKVSSLLTVLLEELGGYIYELRSREEVMEEFYTNNLIVHDEEVNEDFLYDNKYSYIYMFDCNGVYIESVKVEWLAIYNKAYIEMLVIEMDSIFNNWNNKYSKYLSKPNRLNICFSSAKVNNDKELVLFIDKLRKIL